MKTLLILPLLALCSCTSFVDIEVDTRGATPIEPDTDGDGIPDRISVPSDQITPVINDRGTEVLNRKLAEIIINATK